MRGGNHARGPWEQVQHQEAVHTGPREASGFYLCCPDLRPVLTSPRPGPLLLIPSAPAGPSEPTLSDSCAGAPGLSDGPALPPDTRPPPTDSVLPCCPDRQRKAKVALPRFPWDLTSPPAPEAQSDPCQHDRPSRPPGAGADAGGVPLQLGKSFLIISCKRRQDPRPCVCHHRRARPRWWPFHAAASADGQTDNRGLICGALAAPRRGISPHRTVCGLITGVHIPLVLTEDLLPDGREGSREGPVSSEKEGTCAQRFTPVCPSAVMLVTLGWRHLPER